MYHLSNDERPPYASDGAGRYERMDVADGLAFFNGQEGTALAKFGRTLVRAFTSLPDVEVWASRDPSVVVLLILQPHFVIFGVAT